MPCRNHSADRVANLNAERAAENLAQGDATFAKALDQWIGSYGHRSNLLMHEGTRVGIASARSKSGEIYWAMVIAGPEPERRDSAKGAKGKDRALPVDAERHLLCDRDRCARLRECPGLKNRYHLLHQPRRSG